MKIAWSGPLVLPPRTSWREWRRPQAAFQRARDSDVDDWAWETVGVRDEPDPIDWLSIALILLLTSCPAVGMGLMLLLDGL